MLNRHTSSQKVLESHVPPSTIEYERNCSALCVPASIKQICFKKVKNTRQKTLMWNFDLINNPNSPTLEKSLFSQY